jgi:O-antigen/teichoic acid export membrane protein
MLTHIPRPGFLRLIRFRPFDEATPSGRANERHRRVALSAGAAALSKVLGLLATLLSIPLALSYLGAERFGIWSTLSSVVIALQFADLGIGNGLINAVSEAHGRGDRAAIRRYLSSGLMALAAIALGVLLAAPLLATQLPWADWLKLSEPLAKAEIATSVGVTLACIALGIPLGLVQRVQIGLQMGFVASLWQCVSNVVSLVAIWLAAHFQLGLPWLVLGLLGAPLLTALLNAIIFFRRESRDLRPSLRCVSIPEIKNLLSTGGEFLILQIAVSVVYHSDSIIIASVLGTSMVAAYAVPERLFSIVAVLLTTAMSPLWPAYREAISRGDVAWATKTLKRSLIIAFGVSISASLLLVLSGNWLLQHWVGGAVTVGLPLLLALGLWKILEGVGMAVSLFLNGAGVIRFQVMTACAMLVVAIPLKPWLVSRWGIVGAPLGTAAIYALVTLIPLAFVIRRVIREIKSRQPQLGATVATAST